MGFISYKKADNKMKLDEHERKYLKDVYALFLRGEPIIFWIENRLIKEKYFLISGPTFPGMAPTSAYVDITFKGLWLVFLLRKGLI
jgi:hypothetical protein